MNNWQKFWFLIGKIIECVIMGMIGVCIVGSIANAVIGQWITVSLPLGICAILFYLLLVGNRKLTLFVMKCCSLSK